MSSFSDIRSGLLKKYNVRSSDEEDRKETKSTTTVSAPDTTSDFYSIRENLLGKYSQENVTQRRQAVSDWTSRYNKVMENLSSGFGDSGQWKTGQDMDSMEVEIGSLLRDYEDIREYADRTGLPNAFRYANELKKLQEDMPQYRDYFGQWDSQEDYDTFLAEQREIQAKRNLNLSDYQTQIDRKMQTLQRFQNQQGKSGGNQEKIQALEDEIQDMVVYQRQAEFLQRRDRLEAVTESPDFAQGSQYTQDGDDRILYDYINNPDGYRDQYNQDRERLNLLARNPDLQYGGLADVAGLEDGSEDPFQLKGYNLLTDEEIAVYNYYYSTQGSEAARNYLETIQEDLNYRVAINRFQQGYQGNTANGLLYGIEAGVNQAQTGLVNALDAVTGKSDYIPLSSKQILSSLVRDDLAESGWRMPDALGGASLGQAAYDLITTSANMAPSILTSLAVNYIAPGWGSAVGAAMMAGSAAGNAYQEALNAGYGKDRARTYAQLIGTSEGALQYVLGGINALGGKVSGNAIAKALSKVENGLLRAAGQIGGNMLSEGTEEAIQEVLDPIFRNIVLGTDEDVDWEQVAYSGVLGAVTGGIFEGAGMLLNQNANTRSRAGRDSQIPGQSALGSDTSTPGPTSDGVNVEQDTVNPQQADVPTFQETVSPEPVSVPESNAEVEEAVQSSKSISEVAQQYGNQAGAVEQIYRLGSEDQSIDTFEREFGLAYDMGKSGVSESYAMQSQGIQSLTEQQRQFAFQTGQAAAQALAKTQASQNQAAANGKTGWRKGVVKGEGVSIADLTQTFNDPQRTAYKTLSTIAEATGIDIVLYKSQTDANGNFQGAQGKFKWSENAIYIDVNAGLSNVKDVGELSKYTMLRTFDHEFTHFIEKWNPEQYNEFRSTVFDALTEQGENVEDLIDMKLAQDSGGTMTYDMAAREVVAEAMTDILPDSNFVERLASQNRTLFETLLSKIKEFLASVKSYFFKLAGNTSREAKALKKQMGDTVSYLENIVKMFDDAAVKAVETYQATVAEDTQVEKKTETVGTKPKQKPKQAEKPKAPAKNKTREGQKTNTSVSPENQKLTSTADTPSTVVKSLDLNYQKISPSLSVFTDSGNGAYLLYDDNTITPSEVIFHQLNSMDGWTAQGVFYLFRPVMDGKSVDTYKQSELDGFYRIDRVVKRAKLRKVGSTFILDNAGIIEIADYKKPVRSDNSTILKVEKSAVQQEISSQDLKSSEGPKIQDKERKPTEAPAAKTEAAGKAAAASVGEVGEAMVTEVLQENSVATEEVYENTVDGVDIIPAKAETEEAKRELRKAVRMPIEGTNTEAILEGIKNHELSMDSITLRGNVPGFNVEQRTYLVDKLIEGVYSNKKSIKIDVPYDGKFEIVNTPESVAKVLEELKVRVNQEVLLDKRALTLLNSKNNLRYTTIDGQVYLSNGAMMIPSSNAAVDYVKEHYGAKEGNISSSVLDRMKKAGTMIEKAPTEAVTDKKLTVYIFDIDGKKQYYDKRYVSYFDGNKFYAVGGDSLFPLLKVVDSTGEVRGFIAGIHTEESKIHGEKPSKLKSFAQKKVSPAERQTSDTTVTINKGTDKPTNAAVQLPKMDSSSNVQTVESSAKLEDFGEKIGGARKDLWNSRGLLVDDLSQMNDRERSKAVKKDNVWKRPDYRKLVEGGESRGILYARNEIRKALNQNITYPYSTGDGTQSPQYLERVRALQEDFISTVRDIQKLAEQAKSAEDFQNMGRPWLKEHGFLAETNGRDHYTEKWRKNPALKGTDYVITVEYLARNFSKLDALAEKKGFAADAKTQVPKGYSIHQDTLEDGTWFVAKGSYILRHHIPSYEDALTFLKQLSDTRKRKTRFVPQQLLEVHRKGPDYRSGKNVSGQDYLDTFGFRGGEFGNWLNEKDRQVSLNYGFDALKDLADALQIADGDISLGGNLSIAFGARGQGLSGAAAHYEPERHVINLTKMKGAGSLAHEWFHALDDYVGGYQEKMATDNQRNLPEATKAAVRNLITTMQYRDATQEETDLAASKRYEQARRSVTYQVDEMFRWVEKLESGRLTEGETKYFARKPTMEDAQKYHALLNRLLDTGDAAVIEELSDFRKGIYGRVIPKENREAIGYRLFPLKPDANKNVQKMRQYTDFYTNSRRFNDLYQKDGDYWDSTVEMAARAFACYVADKTGANNDYLSAHSDSAVGFDVGKNGDLTVIKAFPEGQERTDINAAFEQLIAALKDDGFLHIQERTEKPGMIQYQDRKQTEEGGHYGESNEGGRAGSRKTDSPGLARGEDSGFGGQSLGSVSAGNQWEGIGEEQRSQIINQLDLYTYDNPESEFYLRLFEDGDLSDLDVHMNAISNMAQQFYKAMQGNRILLENDPRFRWLGDSLGLFIQDVENILSGSFTPVTDEEFQARTHTFSDREILEIAADDLRLDELTEGERDALRIFRDRLARFNDLQDQRSELRKLYMEQQFGANGAKVDRAEAEKTRNRLGVLDGQITRTLNSLLNVENKPVLRQVLQSARKVVEQKQKDADTAMLRRWRDRRNNAEAIRKYRKRIEKDTAALLNMLGHPTKDAHVPLSLQKPLQELLDSINFDSKSKLMGKEITVRDASYTRALQNMRSAVAAQQLEAEGAAENDFSLDVPPDFIAKIDEHIATIDSETKKMNLTTNRVYEMTSSDLEALSSLLRIINKSIRSIDKLHMEGAKARVSDLGKSTMAEMRGQNAVKGESGNTAVWSMLTPVYAFERIGTAASQIFDGLRQGQAKLAWNVESVIRFARDTFTAEEVRSWEHHIHQIELSSGENIRMSDAQIMSFYCLSKRNHAMGHFMGGGIRIGTISKGEAGTIRKDIVQKKSYLIYPEDISKINDLLTQRQRAVAGALQRYMQTAGGRLVNEISMARWDYLAAVEENYFPIATDDTTRDTRNPGQDKSNLWSLLNKSFTKGLQENARNAVVVNSIFDVFADHMSETTEYNAFALPLVDAMRWFNYSETSSVDGTHIKSDGVRKSIQDTLGAAAVKYFVDLMTDINSSQKAGRHEDFMGRLLSRSKASAVGWNLRVAIQQPSAILDASLYLDLGYLLKGAARVKTKQLVEEMQKYSGIAMWKSLGYYDLNVARSVKSQIKGDTGFLDRMNEAGMWLPGKMDEITWARIWAACKEKVKNEQKLSGEELLHQTANLFENVVYHTQVVDSVLTRSSIMRSKSGLIKDATSFMAEPIKKLNILMSTQQDYKAGGKTWGTASKIMRKVFFGFVLGSIANALLASIGDALRDDDEYEDFLDKYRQALWGENFFDGNLFSELNPLEKVVFVRDVLSLLKGYDVNSPYIEVVQAGINLLNNLKNHFEGKGSITGYGLIYQSLRLVGNLTGAAPANVLREAVSIWNNTFGILYPDMLIHQYDSGARDAIRNAYLGGTLPEEEAIQELLSKGVEEDWDDASWTVQKWAADENLDEYYRNVDKDIQQMALTDQLYYAVTNGETEFRRLIEETYRDQRAIDSAMVTGLKDNDSRIIEAAEKQMEGDVLGRQQIADEIASEGLFSSYLVSRAWKSAYNELQGESTSEYSQDFDTYTIQDYFTAAYNGDDLAVSVVYEYLAEQLQEEHYLKHEIEDSLASSFASQVKNAYMKGETDEIKATALLKEYGGRDSYEAETDIKKWDFELKYGYSWGSRARAYRGGDISENDLIEAIMEIEDESWEGAEAEVRFFELEMENEDLDITASEAKKYFEYGEPAGISAAQFLEGLEIKSNATGTDSDGDGEADSYSVVKEVLPKIGRLNLTAYQKTEMAKALGWSEKTINRYKTW